MRDFKDDLAAQRGRLNEAATYLHLEELRTRLAQLEAELSRPDLWDDTEVGQAVTREYGQVKGDIEMLDRLDARLSDAETLHQLAQEEADDTVEAELTELIASASRDLDSLELRSLFTGEHDEHDAVCEIHAKDGGTDAQDWAEMMVRMYQRWAERRGFEFEIEDVSPGQEAGILSASFIIRGRYATGLLMSERGVHRLVRMSPFDAQARRQTSFALMSVVPFFEDVSDEVQIDEKDLRIDTYRSSGAGGQHVNVTDSAVRITHLPTGTVVSVQNERSQHQNKAKAMQILASKLAEQQREARQAELDELAGKKPLVGWGSQVRNYVLAPFQLVKDTRTEYETGNVQGVLEGDLDQFMEAFLRWRRTRSLEPGEAS